jgi:hypothetical protein
METLFSSLDTILDLPFHAFEKRLTKLEEEFKNIAITDIAEEELESYFLRIRDEYESATGDGAKTRLSIIWYLSHFDTLVEKYFPDYVSLFQASLNRADRDEVAEVNFVFLEHMDEILREYTHRLSEPDRYPSYTGYIQELIQNSMIDLFFWLQERETELEKKSEADKNTDIAIKHSTETKESNLALTRRCLECLNEWVLEKIFYDHEYPIRVSPLDAQLQLIGRYERKK